MPLAPPTTGRQAAELFDQLERVSAVVRARITGDADYSPWGRPAWSGSANPTLPRSKDGLPGGVIVHYTAGPTLASSVAWFCKPELNSQRSAHFVVAQSFDTVLSAMERAKYPLIAQLPALPVICRPLDRPGVHASWVNGWAAGFELVNLGCDMASKPAQARQAAVAAGRSWECFTAAQIETTAYLVAALRVLCPHIGLDMVLGHEHVQSGSTPAVLEDKRDPGPLFPWARFRSLCALPGDGLRPLLSDKSAPWALAMSILGYGDSEPTPMQVRIFQHMMGLTVDGKAGPQTQAALVARINDRLALAKPVDLAAVADLWRGRVRRACI